MKKVKVIDQSGDVSESNRTVGFNPIDLNGWPYICCGDDCLPIKESRVVTLEFEDGSKIMADINLNWLKNTANVTMINQNGIEFTTTRFGIDNKDGALLNFAIWLSKDGHNFLLEEERHLCEHHRKGDVNRFSITQKVFDYNGKELVQYSFSATSLDERYEKAYASREKLFNMACEQEG